MQNDQFTATDAETEEPLQEIKPKSFARKLISTYIPFSLIAFSEFGYFFWSNETSAESLTDPAERYLKSYMSDRAWDGFSLGVGYFSATCAFLDAVGSVLGVADISKKIDALGEELKDAKASFSQGNWAYYIVLAVHLTLMVGSYFFGSAMPATGLAASGYTNYFTTLGLGGTWFLGQMFLYILQNVKAIFSTPQLIINFFRLSRSEQWEILSNIFNICSWKSWGFMARTGANVTNRGWSFFGGGQFTQKYLLNYTNNNILPSIAGACGGYNTLTAQGPRGDYKETFKKQEEPPEPPKAGKPELTGLLWYIYIALIIGIFLCRIISKPVQVTGPVDNPEENYDMVTAIKAGVGLFLGVYGSFQYTTKFMAPMLKDALPEVASTVKSVGQLMWKPCKSSSSDLGSPTEGAQYSSLNS